MSSAASAAISPARSGNAAELAREGLLVPATYQQACADEGSVCVTSGSGPGWRRFVPARPRPGGAEPATSLPCASARSALPGVARQPGQYRRFRRHRARNRAGPGDSRGRRRRATWRRRPDRSDKRAALARAQDPVVQRARLPGPIHRPGLAAGPCWSRRDGRGTDGRAAGRAAWTNTQRHGGWREAPGGLWVRTPGCYAWQVDGLSFSEIITLELCIRAALSPRW